MRSGPGMAHAWHRSWKVTYSRNAMLRWRVRLAAARSWGLPPRVEAAAPVVTASRYRLRRIAQALVHGFAWCTLLRIISSLHAAYFSPLLVVDVVHGID